MVTATASELSPAPFTAKATRGHNTCSRDLRPPRPDSHLCSYGSHAAQERNARQRELRRPGGAWGQAFPHLVCGRHLGGAAGREKQAPGREARRPRPHEHSQRHLRTWRVAAGDPGDSGPGFRPKDSPVASETQGLCNAKARVGPIDSSRSDPRWPNAGHDRGQSFPSLPAATRSHRTRGVVSTASEAAQPQHCLPAQTRLPGALRLGPGTTGR